MLKNLQIFLILAVQLLYSVDVPAQINKAERQDNLQQQKITFFNDNLQLTAAESAKFWPVYNDYQNRRDKITRDRNTLMQYYEANKANMSESEANELITKYLGFQNEEIRLLESLTQKLREILPAKKVMRVYTVELEFKKWLLENLRQNKTPVNTRN